jgi:hypothetical protein
MMKTTSSCTRLIWAVGLLSVVSCFVPAQSWIGIDGCAKRTRA